MNALTAVPCAPAPAIPHGLPAGFGIMCEVASDIVAREALLDRVMGPARFSKASERVRRGRQPAPGLAFVTREADGRLVGTVRLWTVRAADAQFLLLGPLAVACEAEGRGIGGALMRHAIAEARRLGHRGIVLVGDIAYYERFGFSSSITTGLAMPGPYASARLLGLDLVAGTLASAVGVIVPDDDMAFQAEALAA